MDYINSRPNKIATIPLETTAQYQPLQELDVNFYTMDINSALFKFIVTQDKEPLSIGEPNVKAQIVLAHEDGSKVVDNLEIYDAMNGILTYKLPNELTKRPGKVTAQVYVARRGKNVKNTSYASVAERVFSFTISNSLIDSVDAETKLSYIARFEEFESIVNNRIKEIQEAFGGVEQYVEKIEQARSKGVSDLELAVTNGLQKIDDRIAEKNREIENKQKEITTFVNLESQKLVEGQSKINSIISNFKAGKGDFLTTSDVEDWQKTALTTENGNTLIKSDVNFTNPDRHFDKSGFYYCMNSTNQPPGKSANAFVEYRKNENVAKVIYYPYDSDEYFIKSKTDTGSWSSWGNVLDKIETVTESQVREQIDAQVRQQISSIKTVSQEQVREQISALREELSRSIKSATQNQSKIYDTGWQQVPFMSGVQADNSLGTSGYRVKNGVCMVVFNAKLTTGSIPELGLPMFKLPDNYSPALPFSFLARTNGVSGKNPVKCSYDHGKKEFKIWQNNDNTIKQDEFIYGTLTFLVED